jgi:hypothetical protein
MIRKVGSETSRAACTKPVQPIYMLKKVGPETFPTACTAYIYDEKVVPKSSPPACTFPVQPTYVMKNLVQRLLLQPVHSLYSLYIC